ncbi:MAG TPA: tetratricopeptide repeat protein [Polyangia bacterium]|jgi:tetratricopeptide (TPR) repeat protein
MFGRTVVFVLGLLVLAPATVAHAQDAPLEESEQQAREFFRQAEINFNLGKFADALAAYQAAYQAKPLTAFLFNIAQCYRYMGKYERARFFYRRYLTLEPKTPNRRVVTDLIAEVTRLMKEPSATPPAPAEAAPPPAAVVATPRRTAAPSTAANRPSSAAAVNLAAPPPVGANETTLVAQPAADTEQAHGKPLYKRWWFWSGLAALIAGGVVTTVLLTRQDPSHGTQLPIDGRN